MQQAQQASAFVASLIKKLEDDLKFGLELYFREPAYDANYINRLLKNKIAERLSSALRSQVSFRSSPFSVVESNGASSIIISADISENLKSVGELQAKKAKKMKEKELAGATVLDDKIAEYVERIKALTENLPGHDKKLQEAIDLINKGIDSFTAEHCKEHSIKNQKDLVDKFKNSASKTMIIKGCVIALGVLLAIGAIVGGIMLMTSGFGTRESNSFTWGLMTALFGPMLTGGGTAAVACVVDAYSQKHAAMDSVIDIDKVKELRDKFQALAGAFEKKIEDMQPKTKHQAALTQQPTNPSLTPSN